MLMMLRNTDTDEILTGIRHGSCARCRSVEDIRRHRRYRLLHPRRRDRVQDAVGGFDADEAAGGACRPAAVQARWAPCEANRRWRAVARLCKADRTAEPGMRSEFHRCRSEGPHPAGRA